MHLVAVGGHVESVIPVDGTLCSLTSVQEVHVHNLNTVKYYFQVLHAIANRSYDQ